MQGTNLSRFFSAQIQQEAGSHGSQRGGSFCITTTDFSYFYVRVIIDSKVVYNFP